MSFNVTPVASRYQEIHPYSAMNIDSVKINTSLIMMKEWCIQASTPAIDSTMCKTVIAIVIDRFDRLSVC